MKQVREATLASKAQQGRPVLPARSCAAEQACKALRARQASKARPARQAREAIAVQVSRAQVVLKVPLARKGQWDELAQWARRWRVRPAQPGERALPERKAQPDIRVLKAPRLPELPG